MGLIKKHVLPKESKEIPHNTFGIIDFLAPNWLRALADILPFFILIYALVNYWYSFRVNLVGENRLDQLQITGFVVYAAIFLVLKNVYLNASKLIDELWQRKIFPEDSKTNLIEFSTKLEVLANHKLLQAVFSLSILLTPLIGIIYSCAEQNATGMGLLFCNYQKGWVRSSKSILEFIIVACLVLMVWRVFVIAWGIQKLGSSFDLRPNWYHPDKSGGLLPVGITCFWIAAVLGIPGIYLGAWQIICLESGTLLCNNIPRLATRMLYFQEYLFFIIVASLISFIWPLWTIHKVMVKKRATLHHGELNTIGQKINEISQQLILNTRRISIPAQVNAADEAKDKIEESGKLQEKLGILQKIYLDLEQLPVWPFNKNIVLQVISTQGIPILGLTGIGSKILEFLRLLIT